MDKLNPLFITHQHALSHFPITNKQRRRQFWNTRDVYLYSSSCDYCWFIGKTWNPWSGCLLEDFFGFRWNPIYFWFNFFDITTNIYLNIKHKSPQNVYHCSFRWISELAQIHLPRSLTISLIAFAFPNEHCTIRRHVHSNKYPQKPHVLMCS